MFILLPGNCSKFGTCLFFSDLVRFDRTGLNCILMQCVKVFSMKYQYLPFCLAVVEKTEKIALLREELPLENINILSLL